VVGHEVADPDRAELPVGQQLLERPVGIEGEVELAGQRLVKDEQVELLDAELACALVEGVQRLLVAVVGDPDLGLEEDVGAVEPGRTDRLADLALVAVGGGGVDVAVAGVERGSDRVAGLVGRRLKDAQAEGPQFDAAVEREGRDGDYGVRPAGRLPVGLGLPAAISRRSAASCFSRRCTSAASSARSAGVFARGRL